MTPADRETATSIAEFDKRGQDWYRQLGFRPPLYELRVIRTLVKQRAGCGRTRDPTASCRNRYNRRSEQMIRPELLSRLCSARDLLRDWEDHPLSIAAVARASGLS